jgi:hypothetical protein
VGDRPEVHEVDSLEDTVIEPLIEDQGLPIQFESGA